MIQRCITTLPLNLTFHSTVPETLSLSAGRSMRGRRISRIMCYLEGCIPRQRIWGWAHAPELKKNNRGKENGWRWKCKKGLIPGARTVTSETPENFFDFSSGRWPDIKLVVKPLEVRRKKRQVLSTLSYYCKVEFKSLALDPIFNCVTWVTWLYNKKCP